MLVAKLAFSRVSVAFRKARRPQAPIMALPPLETKGKVTPVRGSRSVAPKTLRQVWKTIRDAAAQPAMV